MDTETAMDAVVLAGKVCAPSVLIRSPSSSFIPTAFTPNADNLNDLLFVRSPKLTGLEFHIYDRWGNEVFATDDAKDGMRAFTEKRAAEFKGR